MAAGESKVELTPGLRPPRIRHCVRLPHQPRHPRPHAPHPTVAPALGSGCGPV